MKKIVNFLPLMALLAGFSALAADPSSTPASTPDQAEPSAKPDQAQAAPAATEAPNHWQMLREWKANQFKDVLSKAGVDQATSDKVFANFKAMNEEKKAEYKKIKEAFKEKSLKALTDAGLSPEKAQDVMTQYKERTKDMKENFKASVQQFLDKMKGGQTSGDDVKVVEGAPPPEGVPATQMPPIATETPAATAPAAPQK